MFTSKCFLPALLALCFVIDELYAFILPDRLQLSKNPPRFDRDLSQLSDLAELFPDNGGEMTRDWEPKPAQTPADSSPPYISVPLPKTHVHKNKDKRIRVTVPLDRIGSSYLSNRNKKDEPEEHWEYDE